jgi:hypothetical protein
MSGSIARQFRTYLTPFEAAIELSKVLGERFEDADVLRLGLDGHLQLSLYLPVPVKAACYFPDKDGLVDSSRPRPRKEIVGLCDILMVDFGRRRLSSGISGRLPAISFLGFRWRVQRSNRTGFIAPCRAIREKPAYRQEWRVHFLRGPSFASVATSLTRLSPRIGRPAPLIQRLQRTGGSARRNERHSF